jgi:tetratricopeptide (TPR) repeat protein
VPKRLAFLIGNQTFGPDSGLLPLQGPANDLKAVARLLSDPERGGFEVNEFLDKPHYEVLLGIEQALNVAAPSDLFLIYYSGHGKLDRNGRLCLAMANTHQGALLATSIPARHLGDLVEQSDCDQVVLLLDCCYSGAVGVRGDVESELRVVENAHGFYIMTASSDMQAAREEEPSAGGAVMGRFTAALVSGIESGAADRERKGKVLLSDLRRHLEQVVTGQTLKFFARSASGDPLISFSPATAASLLDAQVLADLDAVQWHRRRGAVSALAGVLRDGDVAVRGAAKAALLSRLGQERDYAVRAELELALGLGNIGAPDVSRSPTLLTETITPLKEKAVSSTPSFASVQNEQSTLTTASDASTLFNKGVRLGTLGRSAEAIAVYDDLLARFGTATELPLREQVAHALRNKGVRLSALNRSAEAIAVYDDLLARFGTATELPLREQVAKALRNKGVRLGALNRSAEEIAVYDDLLARFGTATELSLRVQVAKALVNKGVRLGTLGRSAEAIAVYDDLLARFGTATELPLRELVAMALFNKGVRLGALGRSAEAIAVYDDLLARFGTATELPLRELVANAGSRRQDLQKS